MREDAKPPLVFVGLIAFGIVAGLLFAVSALAYDGTAIIVAFGFGALVRGDLRVIDHDKPSLVRFSDGHWVDVGKLPEMVSVATTFAVPIAIAWGIVWGGNHVVFPALRRRRAGRAATAGTADSP